MVRVRLTGKRDHGGEYGNGPGERIFSYGENLLGIYYLAYSVIVSHRSFEFDRAEESPGHKPDNLFFSKNRKKFGPNIVCDKGLPLRGGMNSIRKI